MIFVYCSCINSFYRRTRDFYGEVFYGEVFYGEVFYGEVFYREVFYGEMFYRETSYRGTFYRDVLWRKIQDDIISIPLGDIIWLHHFYTIFLPLLCLPW